MLQSIYLFLASCALGITYAVIPGPVIMMAITETLKKKRRSGWAVILSAQLADFTFAIPLVLALRELLTMSWTGVVVGLAGGAFLLYMAYGAVRPIPSYPKRFDSSVSRDSFAKGYLTNLSNPFMWGFWLTVGSAMIFEGFEIGIAGVLAFLSGFYIGVISCGFIVVYLAARGKVLLSGKKYEIALYVCAISLAGYGVYFMVTGLLSIG
ncbi:MAG: LysE family translocator, partial [Candidatus Geothermarchaeales archaeon]